MSYTRTRMSWLPLLTTHSVKTGLLAGVPIERLPGWIPCTPSTNGSPSPITSGNFPSTNSTSTVRKNTSFTSLPEPPISCSLPIPTIVSGHGLEPFPIGCISPLSGKTRIFGHNSCTGHVISECSCVLPDSFSAYVPTARSPERLSSLPVQEAMVQVAPHHGFLLRYICLHVDTERLYVHGSASFVALRQTGLPRIPPKPG